MAMFEGIPQDLLVLVGGAFALGWLVAKFGVFVSNRVKAKNRDPRDDRIRSLEAEQRIAQTGADKAKDAVESLKKELSEARESLDARQKSLLNYQEKIAELRTDLKDSVRKTRELRAELTDRATESMRSEVKLREVETELEVSRASTDLIATGVLDYSVAPDGDDDEEPSAVKAGS